MPVRPDRNQIPTIRQGIERFLLHCEAAGHKSLKDHISVLRGTYGRVTGQAAKGPALAQSELGGLRFDRATAESFDRWFLARVPVSWRWRPASAHGRPSASSSPTRSPRAGPMSGC